MINEIRTFDGTIVPVEFGEVYFVPSKQDGVFRSDACARARGEDGKVVCLPIGEGWRVEIGRNCPQVHSRVALSLFGGARVWYSRGEDTTTAALWGMRHSYDTANKHTECSSVAPVARGQETVPVELKQVTSAVMIPVSLSSPEVAESRADGEEKITEAEVAELLNSVNRNAHADNSGRFRKSVSRSSRY